MDLTASAFRDYVEKNSGKIIEDAFLSFGSSGVLTHLSRNKGESLYGIGSTSVDTLVQKWKELSINDGQQSVDIDIAGIRSYRGQFHEKYVPEKLEESYYGYLRQSGQNPEDFPFMAFVFQQLTKAIKMWHEKYLWKAVLGAGTSGTELFDGFDKQLADAITATAITPTVFGNLYVRQHNQDTAPGGSTAIVEVVEELVNELDDEVKEGGGFVYMSNTNKTKYNQDYRNTYGTAPTTSKLYNIDRTVVDGTDDAPFYIIGVGGKSGSDRIQVTKKENMVYTYDEEMDMTTWNMQYILNVLHMFGAFRVGSKIVRATDRWIRCNELT